MACIDRRGARPPRGTLPALLVLGAALSHACSRSAAPVDLVHQAAALLREARVAARDLEWVREHVGQQVRINDVVRETLPASPPSLLRFEVKVPAGARLSLAAGIPSDRQARPGVEFVVTVRRKGRDHVVWNELVNPVAKEAHRRWVPVDVDLARFSGETVDLVLETRGFDAHGEVRRAFWGTPALTAPSVQAPLAIIYLVDTLRADHTTPYGYSRDTTPELAAFAKDAVLFETAVAQASWTKPSIASILTSQLPGRHRAVQLRDTLDPGIVTLAEMVRVKGLATGAVIANSVIYSQGTGFEQGFSLFAGMHGPDDRPTKSVEAAPVVDAALNWIDSRRGFASLVFVHTMDPHVPYTPPPPFDRLYEPHPTPEHPAADPRTDYLEPLDRERMLAQFDGEIAYGDREFGRFLRELRARALYDDALIVFMADHGEEFLDHGMWLHGKSVFDELIHVPLVVKLPGQRLAGRRVSQQVQTVDVLPTVLESFSLPVPAPPIIVGRSLRLVAEKGGPPVDAISEISHRGYVAHGIRTQDDKYIRRFSPKEDELFFDLKADPKEQSDRLAESATRASVLRGRVEAAMVSNPYRNAMRFVGSGEYAVKLHTGGWIEGVETTGFGSGESSTIEANGRRLALLVRPGPGASREVVFGVRPMGAPVYVEGTRNGRALARSDFLIAEEGTRPPVLPLRFPEVESNTEEGVTGNIFAAPRRADAPGIHLWLTMTPGRQVMDIDQDACERLMALGYVAQCEGKPGQ
jgi:arylsulfatase A-like enzyme